jgi:hypothetical protein
LRVVGETYEEGRAAVVVSVGAYPSPG